MRRRGQKIGYLHTLLICLTILIGLGTPMAVKAQEIDILQEYRAAYFEPAQSVEVQKYFLGDSKSAKTSVVQEVLIQGAEMMSPRIDVSSYKVTKEDFRAIWEDVLYNTGTLFVVGNSWSYETSGDYVVAIRPNYNSQYTPADVQAYINKRNAVLASTLKKGMTDVEKALALHDYLVAHNSYDLSYSGYSAYDALIRQTSVCDGYAKCYSDLLRTVGIDAMRITSDSMNHAWNVVKINDDWFHVDCTWDDPVRGSGTYSDPVREHPANGYTGRVGHNNFLLSDTGIAKAGTNGHNGWTKAVDCSNTQYDSNADWEGILSAIVFTGQDHYTIMSGSNGYGVYRNYSEWVCPINDVWYAANGAYWTQKFSYLSYAQGYLFYNDSKKVYALMPGKDEPQVVYTYSGAGDIYGCLVENSQAILLIHDGSTTTNYSEGDKSLTVALDLSGLEKPESSLDTPKLLSVKAVELGVEVTWKEVTGAEKYKVLRKTGNGSWTELGCTVAESYTDTAVTDGTTYTYSVCCVSADESFDTSDFDEIGLTIQWKRESTVYKIWYHINGGTNDSANPESGTSEEEILLRDAVRAGYVFGGWYTEEDFVNRVTSIPKGTREDVTLYAKWTEAPHTEHTWDNGVVTKKATCAQEGIRTYTCTVCGATKTETIAKLKTHSYDAGKETKAATCKEEGVKTYICTVCGATKTETIAKLKTHSYDAGKVTRAATCKEEGIKTYTCTVCKATKIEKIPKAAHTYKTTVVKATLKKDGKSTTACTVCGRVKSTKSISHPASITLKETAYTYDGKAKKPGVVIKDAAGKTVSSSNYSVSYEKGRKNIGKYKVTVTFKGNYSGKKSLSFTITPPAPKLSSVTAGSKKLTVKWKKETQATGYELQYSTSKNFTKNTVKTVNIKNKSAVKKTITGLKGKKTYYVRIRTYKTVSGKKYYSAWSSPMKAVTKK